MSLKQYNWIDGEVITAEKLNRGGVTVVGATVETNENSMRVTLDMTLQEIYDATEKGIVVLIIDKQDGNRSINICTGGHLAIPEQEDLGALTFRHLASNDIITFQCATNDSFPYLEQE